MSAIAYTVSATLPDERVEAEYIAWLEDGHVDQVLRHGAHSAMIIRVTDPGLPRCVETRYIFPTRDVFDAYVRQHAPALRAEGQRRFADRGIQFTRTVGTVL